MRYSFTAFVLLCLLSVSSRHALAEDPLPEAKLSIKVLCEEGLPMPGMPVNVWLSESVVGDGQTDSNGLFVVQGVCTTKDVPITIMKDGFYETRSVYQFPNYLSVKDDKWQPWNPVVTVVVRRVVNPIPMYAKAVSSVLPALDEFVGYDLVSGDWVAPYGSGSISDFEFKMKKSFVSIRNFDASLEMAVTNVVDGLTEVKCSSFPGSAYRLPRSAPVEGYGSSLCLTESSTNYFRPNQDQSFVFRVRCATNAEGNVESALYGKIGGYVGFDVRRHKTGIVKFTYYLNPVENDRNLEFDPGRNLFNGLKSTEQVTAP